MPDALEIPGMIGACWDFLASSTKQNKQNYYWTLKELDILRINNNRRLAKDRGKNYDFLFDILASDLSGQLGNM